MSPRYFRNEYFKITHQPFEHINDQKEGMRQWVWSISVLDREQKFWTNQDYELWWDVESRSFSEAGIPSRAQYSWLELKFWTEPYK